MNIGFHYRTTEYVWKKLQAFSLCDMRGSQKDRQLVRWSDLWKTTHSLVRWLLRVQQQSVTWPADIDLERLEKSLCAIITTPTTNNNDNVGFFFGPTK
jgi:hypothetical protein